MRLTMPNMVLLTFPEMADAVETVIAAAPEPMATPAMAARRPEEDPRLRPPRF
jgi:hypothetical protein